MYVCIYNKEECTQVSQAHVGNSQAAMQAFAQVRARDEHFMDKMDVYAEVLKENGDSAVLNKLTYSLLDTDVHRSS